MMRTGEQIPRSTGSTSERVYRILTGLIRGYPRPTMTPSASDQRRSPQRSLASVTRAMPRERGSAAVLISGGLDSAVLAVELVRDHVRVHPLYVRSGLRWEDAELAAARAFLAAVRAPGLESLVILDEPISDVYGPHWSTGGDEVPGSETPDEAVYLPGATSCSRSRQRSGASSATLARWRSVAWARTPFPTALRVSSRISSCCWAGRWEGAPG